MALLDERHPGWDRYVSLYSLDVSLPKTCVLGQVGRVFLPKTEYPLLAMMTALRPYLRDKSLAAFGFTTMDDYARLTGAWKRAIQARRDEQQTEALG